MLRRCLVIMAACFLAATGALASDVTGRLGLGLEVGLMKLVGSNWDYSNVDEEFTFRVQKGLSSHWSLQLALKYGYVRPGVTSPDEKAGLSTEGAQGFYTVIWEPSAGLLYHFTPEKSFGPFLGASVGAVAWSVRDLRGESAPSFFVDGPVLYGYDTDGVYQELSRTDAALILAAGADWFLSDSFNFNFGFRYHWFPFNKLDNIGMSHVWGQEYVDANTGLVEGYIGFAYFFGSHDDDRDGIPNKMDGCPKDPEDFDGYQDSDGCPDPDNDMDGIPDDEDGCRDSPEDVDGFQDSDGCPDPDNDGDGIPDTADACPDDPEDLDGFEDDDGCPDPDNDMDGVPDLVDQCPGTPAGVVVDEVGCPVIEEIKEPLVLEGVSFLSGSAVLTPESSAVLEKVAESLLAYPEVKIEIRGHTDSTGSAELNLNLSQKRAISVRDFLLARGVDPARVTAIGLGEDYPIAPNDTQDGRAKNRRVEIHRTDR